MRFPPSSNNLTVPSVATKQAGFQSHRHPTPRTVGIPTLDDVAPFARFPEVQILNPRIHLIYHATTQKSGAKAEGLDRLTKAKNLIPQIEKEVSESVELAKVAPLAQRLREQMSTYEADPQKVLDGVSKRLSKEETRPLIARRAAAGGDLVGTSAEVYRTGEDLAISTD